MIRMKRKGKTVLLVDGEVGVQLREGNFDGICVHSAAKLLAPSEPTAAAMKEDEQYIYPQFRALSKIVIPGYWLNFTLGDVLKKSVGLLLNQTVYPNHDRDVNQWLGVVAEAMWSDTEEPNGIDVVLKIDKINSPRIAAGLKMRPPAIHSGSVGIRFKWQKSHPDLENFWYKLGAEVDGKTVTIDITEITSFDEFSLVYQGGDPNAKQKLRLPDFGNEQETNARPNAGATALQNIEAHAQEETNVKLKKKLCEKLGLKTETLFAKGGEEIELTQETFDGLMLDIGRVNEAQEQEIAALKPKAELGEKFEKSQRDDAEKFYRLCAGENVDEGLIKTLQTAPMETVAALAKDYKSRAEQLHPGVDRQSSSTGADLSQATRSDKADVANFKIK